MIDDIILNEFLKESNAIEGVYTEKAQKDAYKAWKFLETYEELSENRIREVHRLLMINLNKRIAGEFRKVNVRVGIHIMPQPKTILSKLENLIFYFIPKNEEEIKKWHVLFENIHPFEDGNGRVGRILMNWHRIKNNLPILTIHTGIEQFEYYDWFKESIDISSYFLNKNEQKNRC